jgi:hypothetical protein
VDGQMKKEVRLVLWEIQVPKDLSISQRRPHLLFGDRNFSGILHHYAM